MPTEIGNVIALAAGSDYCVALTEDGRVLAWGGTNSRGQCNVPQNLGKCVAVRSAYLAAAAKKEDGSWFAWGDNTSGVVDKVNSLGPVTDIAFGGSPSQPPFGFVLWIKADVE